MTKRYVTFIAAMLAIVVVWGAVLPYLATTRTVRQRTNWLEENQIDPAAMYYTELPMMDDVLRRIER